MCAKALADPGQYYPPPNSIRRLQHTQSSGSRGCIKSIPTSFNLLTPTDYAGTTISGHPTFLLYVSSVPSVPMDFTLIDENKPGSILEKRIYISKPGIVQVKLPSDVPELAVSKNYRWTISLVCNDKRLSENIYAYAWIRRVPAKPEFIKQVALAAGDRERATLYARSGLWYDAMAAIYKAYSANLPERQTVEDFFQYLNEIGLARLAVREEQLRAIGTKGTSK